MSKMSDFALMVLFSIARYNEIRIDNENESQDWGFESSLLTSHDLIRPVPSDVKTNQYQITERGRFYTKMLRDVPLPKKGPKFIDPRT